MIEIRVRPVAIHGSRREHGDERKVRAARLEAAWMWKRCWANLASGFLCSAALAQNNGRLLDDVVLPQSRGDVHLAAARRVARKPSKCELVVAPVRAPSNLSFNLLATQLAHRIPQPLKLLVVIINSV